MTFRLIKVDDLPIPDKKKEIRCFSCLKNEVSRLRYFLEYYRKIGIDRFFFIDNGSDDGSVEFLLNQADCHVFDCDGSYFEENISPPRWHNAILNAFGHGHWTLTVDADEILVYPHCEEVPLPELVLYLDGKNVDAMVSPMVDMYSRGPALAARYELAAPFMETCNYFDGDLPRQRSTAHLFPPIQLLGGVRERVFWGDRLSGELPPCLTKVALVKWSRSRRYLVSTHFISDARFADIQGNLLHFKFLPGFFDSSLLQTDSNPNVVEKSLSERLAYIAAFKENPNLSLWYPGSCEYRSSNQLVKLGHSKTSADFEAFVSKLTDRQAKSSGSHYMDGLAKT